MDGTPGPSAAAPIRAGRYELTGRQGLQAGGHSVFILAARERRETGNRPGAPAGASHPKTNPDATAAADAAQYDAVQYDVVQYSATVEVSPGENTKDFELGSLGPGF